MVWSMLIIRVLCSMRFGIRGFIVLCCWIASFRCDPSGRPRPDPPPNTGILTNHPHTDAPTEFPTISYFYFSELFPVPNNNPTRYPSIQHILTPTTTNPSPLPSLIPSQGPSSQPTADKTKAPTTKPSLVPLVASSLQPSTSAVSGTLTARPSRRPMVQPAHAASGYVPDPTAFPTAHATPSPGFNLLEYLNSPKFIFTSSALAGFLLVCAIIYRNTNKEFVKLFCLRFMTIGFRSIQYKQRRTIIPLASIVTTSDTFASPDSALPSPSSRSNRYTLRTSPSHRRTYPISSALDMIPIPAELSPSTRIAIVDAQPYDTARDERSDDPDLAWNAALSTSNTSERLRANRRIPRGVPLDAITLPTPRVPSDGIDIDSEIVFSPPARRSRAFLQWSQRSTRTGNRFSRSTDTTAVNVSTVNLPTYV
jgi:hypothetical protein